MARNKKTSKLKEPIRLRMKDLSNGNKSLYLDIYRDGKRSYEYLKMYIIPETDDEARKRNQATLIAANAIKSQRIIAMTNGEAGIKKADDKPKVLLADWLQTYKERQKKRGRKDEAQINTSIRILTEMGCENMTMDDVDKKFCQDFIDYLRDGYKTRKGIIRKTKRFAIPERAVYFLKTKRTAGDTPPPQNIFDRLTPVFT